MGSRSNWHCWEIMQCRKSKNCPAKDTPQKNCWEIAREMYDDYRSYFNICRDCIVYVIKTSNPVLSNREIGEIIKSKTKCPLTEGPTRPRLHVKNVQHPHRR